ncbi:hypothetical protein PHET_02785 [Paragonimus heterotremus]|uniref:Uncharacterized protein n=1 Tax=Paragonimus heterotremus TaxID=100268 RepID=A0A8J4TIK9_9TREM|nr:hypothetical protein PHET_02785 [Paragonimus heterotremus]
MSLPTISVVSDSESSLIISEDFVRLRNECAELLHDMNSWIDRLDNRPNTNRPFTHPRNLSAFQVTYIELRQWLNYIQRCSHRRSNMSLCRCESYLSQNYLEALISRETDFNRLCVLGCEILNGDISSSSLSSMLASFFEDDKMPSLRDSIIAEQLTEITRMWHDTMKHQRCDKPCCFRYIELDIEEAEAKLRSTNRQTYNLKIMLTRSSPSINVSLAGAIDELKAQHVALKQALRTLSFAGRLLQLLASSTVDPVVQGTQLSNEVKPQAIYDQEVKEATDTRYLTERIQDLMDAAYDIWVLQLELRERWKFHCRPAVANELNESGSLRGSRCRRFSMSHTSDWSSPLLKTDRHTQALSPSPLDPARNPFCSTPDLRCAPHSRQVFQSPALVGQALQVQHEIAGQRISSTTLPSSLAFKESGFGSDSNRTLPSIPSSRSAVLQCNDSPPRFGAIPIDPQPWNSAKSCFYPNCHGATSSPSLDGTRSLSLDCLWSSHFSPTDAVNQQGESQNADSIHLFETRSHTQLDRGVPLGIRLDNLASSSDAIISPFRYAEFENSLERHYQQQDHFCRPEMLTADVRSASDDEDHEETTFSELLPSNAETDNTGSASSPSSFGLIASPIQSQSRNRTNVTAAESLGAGLTAVRPSEPANEGLEWDDSGDLRWRGIKSGSLDSGFGFHLYPIPSGGDGNSRVAANVYNGFDGRSSTRVSTDVFASSTPDSIHRSSLTLAAEAADAFVCARLHTSNHQLSYAWNSPDQSKNCMLKTNICKQALDAVCCSTPTRTSFYGSNPPTDSSKATYAPLSPRLNSSPRTNESGRTDYTEAVVNTSQLPRSESLLSLFTFQQNPLVLENGFQKPSNDTPKNSTLHGDANVNIRSSFLTPSDLYLFLKSIHQEAVPLVNLLTRLEQASLPGIASGENDAQCFQSDSNLTSCDAERERIQLDIDLSFLQYYARHLTQWSTASDVLYKQLKELAPSSSQINEITLAIHVFIDWVNALQTSRLLASLLRLAQYFYRLFGTIMHLFSCIQNLVESVCAIQLRCGVFRSYDELSCDHLAGFADLHTVTPNPGSLTNPVCLSRDHKLSPSLSLLSSVLRTLNQRTLTLKQRLRVAIRRLERSAVSSSLDFTHFHESPYAPNSSAYGSPVLVDQLSTRLDEGCDRNRIAPDCLEKRSNGNIAVNPPCSSLNSVHKNRLCLSECTSHLRTIRLPLFVFLIFTCLCLIFHIFGRSRDNWSPARRPLFCRLRPGFILAELSLNWWLRQIACLHLPDSKEIPF